MDADVGTPPSAEEAVAGVVAQVAQGAQLSTAFLAQLASVTNDPSSTPTVFDAVVDLYSYLSEPSGVPPLPPGVLPEVVTLADFERYLRGLAGSWPAFVAAREGEARAAQPREPGGAGAAPPCCDACACARASAVASARRQAVRRRAVRCSAVSHSATHSPALAGLPGSSGDGSADSLLQVRSRAPGRTQQGACSRPLPRAEAPPTAPARPGHAGGPRHLLRPRL